MIIRCHFLRAGGSLLDSNQNLPILLAGGGMGGLKRDGE
jgi:hypothetical protein